MEVNNSTLRLYKEIAQFIKQAKTRVAISANSELIQLYYQVGKHINKYILNDNRASYGKSVIKKLSELLTQNFGGGWNEKTIRHSLRVAETFSENDIVSAVQRQLSWTHIKTIAYEKNNLKRKFYLEMTINQQWNTRTLSEQMNKMLFERTAISQQPDEQIEQALLSLNTNNLINPDLFFKKTYILNFLGLPNIYSEKSLENALISNIEFFILELGNGFAFIERQKRINIDTVDYHLDLLFYHRKLKRLVAVDLKLGKFKPKYKAQMELYLRWLEKNEMQTDEEKPIGLLLCSEGNTEHIELLMLDNKEIKVAQYLTELPSKMWFADKLNKSLELAKMKIDEESKNE